MPDPGKGVVTSLTGQARQMQGAASPFGFGFYGPGQPQPPMTPDQDPRQWDFSPGYNMNSGPRNAEPYGFANLRAFANVELVRMAIETRKDQLERLDWMVKPRENKEARAQLKTGAKRDERAIAIEKFLAKPDGVTAFGSFMRALDEDMLALDAPAVELRRKRNGELIGLEMVDGSTINLLVDQTGRRPRDPTVPAYQQIIRGMVWANLTNRDLLYLPRNVRTGHVYGFGPVEQIVVTINTIIRRQASQLSYFTAGNVPAGILNAPEGWTNQQIRDLQTWFDERIGGNQAAQRTLVWVPKDAKYQAFKDSPIKDEFDEWLARLVAFAFSLPPTPFVRQMNKGTANEDQDRALEEGLEPLKIHRKRWLDDLIATEFAAPDLEFAWREDVDIDAAKQGELDDRRLRNGSATLDEVRDRAGDDPYEGGLGSKAMVYLPTGPVPLDAIEKLIEKQLNPPEPTVVGPDGNPVPQGKPPGAKDGKPPVGNGSARPKPAKDGKPSAPGDVTKGWEEQERDEHGRWAGGGGGDSGGGSVEHDGGSGSTTSGDDSGGATDTNTGGGDAPIEQLTPQQMQEVFGILADAHPPAMFGDLRGGETARELGEWDETLDHSAWERQGDFMPWQAASGDKALIAQWFAEALTAWRKRQQSSALGSKKKCSGHVAKADIPDSAFALSVDRPEALKAAARLKKALKPILKKVGEDVAEAVRHKLNKAEIVIPDANADEQAGVLSAAIDLSGLLAMSLPLQQQTETIAAASGKLALFSIGVEDPLQLVDQVNLSATEWAREHAADLLSLIGEANDSLIASTRNLVRNVIADGLEENVGRDVIADRIAESAAFSEYRAEMIANTEIAFANAAGKKAGWDAAREGSNLAMLKQWYISEDEGVCEECEGNADQGEIPYDDEFESGDDMEPAHPNCRCVTTARFVEPDEGEGEEE